MKSYPGETLAARPEAQALLTDVEAGIWDGVLVMEVERLARGDTIDQGIVSQAFKYSGTLIITPMKTYDPSNEYDEEYFEFGLFMSRREYKAIRRRLEAGRYASLQKKESLSVHIVRMVTAKRNWKTTKALLWKLFRKKQGLLKWSTTYISTG